jgi:hypothetical protein
VDSLALVKQNVLTNPVTGTGTTNYVPKFTGTSTIGNSTIFDNGNVGIGTTSPVNNGSNTTTLTINAASQGILQMQNNATKFLEIYSVAGVGANPNDTRIEVPATYNTIFRRGSSESMQITSSGELLINTTTDAGDYKLQVSGNAYVTGTTVLAATSGNVGVGTASPTADGTIDVVSSSNNYMRIRSSTALRAYMYFQNSLTGTTTSDGMNIGVNDAGNMFINNRESSDLYIGTSNATRMTVTAAGEILINTVSDAGDYKLQVSGNVAISGTYTSAAPTDGTAAPWRLGSYVTTAPTATGFVQVEINGVKYKLLAATY